MSSLRKIESARANGARSHGPATPEGKARSAQNAMRHGLLARHIMLDNEGREGFDALFELHLERLQPADGVEFGFVEEMVSSYWRMRRAWAIETRLMQKHLDKQNGLDEIDRLAGAFQNLSASQSIGLIHRYETRLHCMYQRALKNLLLLRKARAPNDPNPISEQCEDGPEALPVPEPPEMPNDPSPVSGHLGTAPGGLADSGPQPPDQVETQNEPIPVPVATAPRLRELPCPLPQPLAPIHPRQNSAAGRKLCFSRIAIRPIRPRAWAKTVSKWSASQCRVPRSLTAPSAARCHRTGAGGQDLNHGDTFLDIPPRRRDAES